ncbi:ATP-binding cassette domain-containing protein [Photorhabdus luminescens]|nr:ATP-binding cassette domain-containing protein [Photorhabdus luminescens]
MSFSLDLTKNKITCIVGKNGIGKTTFIKSIKIYNQPIYS